MNQDKIRPRFRFKTPRDLKSKQSTCESKVEFKNLTNDVVFLYWIDFEGRAKFYGELNPINRLDTGIKLTTFVSHPWVAILPGKVQGLLNGKRYFFPPNPNTWLHNQNGGLNLKWVLPRAMDHVTDNQHFEVLILKAGRFF